jgi:hypothetical protein
MVSENARRNRVLDKDLATSYRIYILYRKWLSKDL